MVERKTELGRQRARRKKMFKLKALLAKAKTNSDRDKILARIHRISPFWVAPKTAAAK